MGVVSLKLGVFFSSQIARLYNHSTHTKIPRSPPGMVPTSLIVHSQVLTPLATIFQSVRLLQCRQSQMTETSIQQFQAITHLPVDDLEVLERTCVRRLEVP